MSTTIDNTVTEGVRLCPISAIADQIDQSRERRRLVINHPCYQAEPYDTDPETGESKIRYVRKSCRGEDSTCLAHPSYVKL